MFDVVDGETQRGSGQTLKGCVPSKTFALFLILLTLDADIQVLFGRCPGRTPNTDTFSLRARTTAK